MNDFFKVRCIIYILIIAVIGYQVHLKLIDIFHVRSDVDDEKYKINENISSILEWEEKSTQYSKEVLSPFMKVLINYQRGAINVRRDKRKSY